MSDTSIDIRKQVEIKREGRTITLPPSMEIDEAITWLNRRKKEEEQEVAISETIEAFPPDGAVALQRALDDLYGWTALSSTPGFFGDNPPRMIGVRVGPTETIKVPWGRIVIPGMSGYLETGMEDTTRGPLFRITGIVKQKHYGMAVEVIDRTRAFVRERSIYKGRAIRIDLSNGDAFAAMSFLDLTKVRPDEIIFSREIEKQVEACIMAPVRNRELCSRLGVPTKRGILAEGPYGTGKTLLAKAAAKVCQEHGWTFVLLDNVHDLARAIDLASRYTPAMVFAEDVDRAVGLERTTEVDQILNTVDGIAHKDSEILLVLTTNHVDQINPAMLRPGRLDAVISVTPPDGEAVARLVRLYGRDVLVATDEQLVPVGEALRGNIPAIIREVVERAKLFAVAERVREGNGGAAALKISADDLMAASRIVLQQVALLQPKAPEKAPTIDRAFRELFASAGGGVGEFNVEVELEKLNVKADAIRAVAANAKTQAEVAASSSGATRRVAEKTLGVVEEIKDNM